MAGWIVHYPERPKPYLARFQPSGSRTVSKSFDKIGDAKRWLATQVTAEGRGEYIDPRSSTPTLASWAESWSAGRRVRASTRARDDSVIRSLILPHLGKRPLGKITTAMLRVWVADLEASGRAPATVQKAYQLAAAMLEQAVTDGRLVKNPARHVDLPATVRSEKRFLTVDQVDLLAGMIDPRYSLLVKMAAFTGLRFGELAGLKASDLDLNRGRVTVTRTVNEVRGRLVVGEPKTAAGRRTVSLPHTLVDDLKVHLDGMNVFRLQDPDRWLFPAPEGGPLRRNGFRIRFWQPAVAKAKLDGLRFHDLRHTQAAWLIALGEHPKLIQTRLGHASITTTMDVYGHLFEGLDGAVAERLDQTIVGRSRRTV